MIPIGLRQVHNIAGGGRGCVILSGSFEVQCMFYTARLHGPYM